MQAIANQTSLKTEYENAVQHAGWEEVGVGLVRVAGPDRVKWLHKIITADVEHLGVGQGARAALLDAKGHYLADFVVLVEQDAILLLTAAETASDLLGGLRRYIIREKVQLGDETGLWRSFTLIGPESDGVAAQVFGQVAPALPYSFSRAADRFTGLQIIRTTRGEVPSTDLLADSDVGERVKQALGSIPELSDAVLETLRIEAGLPKWSVDFDSATLVLEIPDVHSVRVDQGCYVGQEVVARLVHRGHVNRQLVGLKFEGQNMPAYGSVILAEGKEVGSVTSLAVSPRFGMIGLGYVRRDASEIGTPLETRDHVRAQIARIPFEE